MSRTRGREWETALEEVLVDGVELAVLEPLELCGMLSVVKALLLRCGLARAQGPLSGCEVGEELGVADDADLTRSILLKSMVLQQAPLESFSSLVGIECALQSVWVDLFDFL